MSFVLFHIPITAKIVSVQITSNVVLVKTLSHLTNVSHFNFYFQVTTIVGILHTSVLYHLL